MLSSYVNAFWSPNPGQLEKFSVFIRPEQRLEMGIMQMLRARATSVEDIRLIFRPELLEMKIYGNLWITDESDYWPIGQIYWNLMHPVLSWSNSLCKNEQMLPNR